MDFNFTPDDEAFRKEFRAWLDVNAPRQAVSELDTFSEEDEGEWHRRGAWFRKLARGGWAGIDWPKGKSGRRAGVLQTIADHHEHTRRHAPLPHVGSRG